jgi:hypothetical protein
LFSAVVLTLVLVLVGFTIPISAITNGEPDVDRHPYVCLVVFDVLGPGGTPIPAWRATGTLIAPGVVLTAGHATDGAVAARVWFDEIVQGNPEYPFGGSTSTEGTPYTHPEFSIGFGEGLPGFTTHDVGIVVLDEPVIMAEYGELPAADLVDT